MREQEQICENFTTIIKSKEIRKFAGDAFWDFVQSLFAGDTFSGLPSIRSVKDMFFNIPTILFWNKMQRFLLGTYKSFEEQVKMAEKFSNDNEKYKEFVLQMFETVDKLDFETKIDYYANLTRSYLLELIDEDLFYALRRVIMDCTNHELKFISNTNEDQSLKYDMMIFSLNRMGLVEQKSDNNSNFYFLTDLSLKLKEHALNSDEHPKHPTAYSELKAPSTFDFNFEPITKEEINKMFENLESDFQTV